MSLRHLDLFSGIGGFSLAAQMVGGIETKQFVEIDPYCQKVLAKNFPGIPIHDDIRTFTANSGDFDLVTFGSPCQDLSKANPNGRGLEGERSGLFYEAIRIIRLVRPRYTVFENVSAILTKDKGRHFQLILRAFYESGFDAEWQVVSAASVGAEHLRERLFIVSYSQRLRWNGWRQSIKSSRQNPSIGSQSSVFISGLVRSNLWQMPSRNGRTSNGLSRRVDRLRGLGNSVVPQVAAIALQRVLELEAMQEAAA